MLEINVGPGRPMNCETSFRAYFTIQVYTSIVCMPRGIGTKYMALYVQQLIVSHL
jgi:hypothetical protein